MSRILIFDDQHKFRAQLCPLLTQTDLVVGKASDIPEA